MTERFTVCHWLCQCDTLFARSVSESTGEASGTPVRKLCLDQSMYRNSADAKRLWQRAVIVAVPRSLRLVEEAN